MKFIVILNLRFSIALVAAIVMVAPNLLGQERERERERELKIYFDAGNSSLGSESSNLDSLDQVLADLRARNWRSLRSIEVAGHVSPEGVLWFNDELALRRMEVILRYIEEQGGVPHNLLCPAKGGVQWMRLLSLIEHQNQPYAPQVRKIIDEECGDWVITKRLEQVDNGAVYAALMDYIFPLLRNAAITINYSVAQPIKDCCIELPVPGAEPLTLIPITHPTPFAPSLLLASHPLFAIKTNLLFDIATLVNLEIEVPIKKRYSVAGEMIFPWWHWDDGTENSRRNRIEIRTATLEGRYWWGDRESQPLLTGWFTGLYAGIGLYDLEHNAKGYQGNVAILAGLGGGYAHTINRAKTLRLEYALGVGWLDTDYQYYHSQFCVNQKWHAIEQRNGRYIYFGLTRARVSLSWLINSKRRR